MLDPNFVRNNFELVLQKMAQRGLPAEILDRFGELDQRRRSLVRRRDDLNAQRNRESQEIGKLMKEGRKDEAASRREAVRKAADEQADAETQVTQIEQELDALLTTLPNPPHDSVPIGKDESANVEVRRVGQPRHFDFQALDHVELGTRLGILDIERATKIAGARFALLTGMGARLERALIDFCLSVQTRRHGYREVVPPIIVNGKALFGTGQLPKFEGDLFKIDDPRNFYLIPTAEVPLTNIYSGEILDASELPINLTAYTPCFRSEAGSYGKDTRGLIRLHQFNKVEMVKLTRPEESYAHLETMTANAEAILAELGLPYRTVCLSTGDMGFQSAKTYDIEVWLPSQNTYREISSCSNCESFQARRADIRYRPAAGAKPEFVHTLNGSGLAIGRTWVAVLENYQQEDGSILIPDALQPFMDGIQVIRAGE